MAYCGRGSSLGGDGATLPSSVMVNVWALTNLSRPRMMVSVCCFRVGMGVSSGENEHGSAKGRRQDYRACNPLFILSTSIITRGPLSLSVSETPGTAGGWLPCN